MTLLPIWSELLIRSTTISYLGYKIHVRNVWQRDGVEADIVGKDGNYISIQDGNRIAAEETAREIVNYATSHNISLDVASKYVLV